MWAWTSLTELRLERHDLSLPDELLAHVREQKYRMPAKAQLDRLELTIPRDDSGY